MSSRSPAKSTSAADLLSQPPHPAPSRPPPLSTNALPPSGGSKPKGFRFSTGAPPPAPSLPVASTSTLAIPPTAHGKRPRSASPKSEVKPEVVVAPEEGNGKGKGKENEGESTRTKEYANQEKSLMNRLAGPSDQKAGLKRNPEEVKRIIYESSKGSAYYQNEARKDEELSKKVAVLVERVDRLVRERRGDLRREEAAADAMLRELEKGRVLSETIVVVDADAFYASCHELGQPELKGTAFAVGGGADGSGGVLTTASYEARKFGCRSAMAGFVAKKLCPELVFIPLDFSLYTSISKNIMAVLGEYGDISPASLDEAYCSLTDYCKTHGVTPAEAAETMRAHVKRETGCTVSAGVSSNCLISKIAADMKKPDGQFVVEPTREAAIEFMRSLPCRRVPGIGRVTERWLQGLGVETVDDVHRLRGKLYLVHKEIGLTFLLRAYLGLGTTTIKSRDRSERKGVGCEQTFSTLSDPAEMYPRLRKIADSLAEDLKVGQWSARTLTLKLKLETFESLTRAKTLGKDIFFSDAETLYREGKKLLDKEIADRKKGGKRGEKGKGGQELKIRLMGLRVNNIRDDSKGKKGGAKVGLDQWAGQSKPSTSGAGASKSKSKPKPKPPQPAAAVKPSIKVKAEREFESPYELDSPDEAEDVKPPASSDPLWAAIDVEDGDSAVLAALDEMDDDDGEEEEAKYKPFFTGGPSLNSKLEMEMPVPESDRLGFDPPVLDLDSDSEEGQSGGAGRVRTLECPVCLKSFLASEAALSAHVDGHFGGDDWGSSVGRGGGGAQGRAPPRKKVKTKATIESYFGGRR